MGEFRQFGGNDIFEKLQCFTKRITVGQTCIDGDGAQPVVAIEISCAGGLLKVDQIGKRDQLAAVVRADIDISQVAGAGALVFLRLQDDVRCSLIIAPRVRPMFSTDTPSAAARFLSTRTTT